MEIVVVVMVMDGTMFADADAVVAMGGCGGHGNGGRSWHQAAGSSSLPGCLTDNRICHVDNQICLVDNWIQNRSKAQMTTSCNGPRIVVANKQCPKTSSAQHVHQAPVSL